MARVGAVELEQGAMGVLGDLAVQLKGFLDKHQLWREWDAYATLPLHAFMAHVPPPGVDELARVLVHIRGAHNGPDQEPGAPPCGWCQLQAEQAHAAIAELERLRIEEQGERP